MITLKNQNEYNLKLKDGVFLLTDDYIKDYKSELKNLFTNKALQDIIHDMRALCIVSTMNGAMDIDKARQYKYALDGLVDIINDANNRVIQ
jgi:hypothetical protein